MLSCLGSGEGSRPGLQMAIFLLCPRMAEGGKKRERRRRGVCSDVSSYKGINTIMEALASSPNLNLVTSQCRYWSAVYYTSRPKAESPLSQGPQPTFVKIFCTPCVHVQTHQPKSLEAYKGRVNTITITPSFMCSLFKQLIINKPAVIFQPVNNR